MRRRVSLALLCAATLNAQQDTDPATLLTSIEAKSAENLERMPDYVCIQTVERAHRATPKEISGDSVTDSPETIAICLHEQQFRGQPETFIYQ